MKLLIYLIVTMFFAGVLSYISSRKHFLIMLLSLEFLMLSLYLIMFVNMSFNNTNLNFLMIYLTMAVCEGVLGLSMMVLMIRMVGNDFVKNMNFLW